MFQLESNCSFSSNATTGDYSLGLIFEVLMILLGFTNLILNSLCVAVFLMYRSRDTSVRFLLLLLSGTEVLSSFGMTSVGILRLVLETYSLLFQKALLSYGTTLVLIRYLTISWCIANAFLISRNWCIVLIALSRCEAVLRPFSRNTGRLFTRKVSGCIFAFIVLISIVVGSLRSFQERFIYCDESNTIVGHELLEFFPHYPDFVIACLLAQAVIPVAIVAVVTIAMTIGLRRHSNLGGTPSVSNNKATRMIQILLTVFVALELPMFIAVLLDMKTGNLPDFVSKSIVSAANLCINMDSTANFIIYMKTSASFRSTVLRKRDRSVPMYSVTQTTVRTNDMPLLPTRLYE